MMRGALADIRHVKQRDASILNKFHTNEPVNVFEKKSVIFTHTKIREYHVFICFFSFFASSFFSRYNKITLNGKK